MSRNKAHDGKGIEILVRKNINENIYILQKEHNVT